MRLCTSRTMGWARQTSAPAEGVAALQAYRRIHDQPLRGMGKAAFDVAKVFDDLLFLEVQEPGKLSCRERLAPQKSQ